VLPVSLTNTHLCAKLENGHVVVGETNIDVAKHDGSLRIKELYLQSPAEIYEETRHAIMDADLIVIGPGDLYSSVIPNLLVEGVPEALRKSKAKKAYVCNLMTKWGETHGYAASDFAKEILRYAPGLTLDYVLCNNTRVTDGALLSKYAAEKSFPVIVDEAVHTLAKKVVLEDLITQPDLIRHDTSKLARVLREL
jgi:uncharacterized cofD-like protein